MAKTTMTAKVRGVASKGIATYVAALRVCVEKHGGVCEGKTTALKLSFPTIK